MTIQLRPHQAEALNKIVNYNKGTFTMPTGSGKTIIGIRDVINQFKSIEPRTVCVVAPRILLSKQLCSEYLEHISNAQVLCVHSGKNRYYNTTKTDDIVEWVNVYHKDKHKLIFTTYHSLKKVKAADVKIDTYIFDEAHNSIRSDFYEAVQEKHDQSRCFFFTATPKYSHTKKPGMNNTDIYGTNICNVRADYLVDNGFILKPEINIPEFEDDENIAERDYKVITDIIEKENIDKVMVVAKSTKNIIALFGLTKFETTMKDLGYSVMSITSQYGGYIDGKTYDKDDFFRILNEWGRDEKKKFIVFQYSMIGEGINLSCLNSVIFMRHLDIVSILQNIGRCIRIHPRDIIGMKNGTVIPGDPSTYHKPYGRVFIPVFDKISLRTAQEIGNVVDRTFNKGELVIAEVKK